MTLAVLGSRGVPAKYGGFERVVESLALYLPLPMYIFCEGRGSSKSYFDNRMKYKSSIVHIWHGFGRIEYKFSHIMLIFVPVFEHFRIISEVMYDIISLIWCTLRADVDKIYLLGYGASPFIIIPQLFGKKVYVNVDGLEWKRAKWGFPIRQLLHFCEWFTGFANYKVFDSKAVWAQHNQMYGSHPSFFLPHCIDKYEYPNEIESYYLVMCRLEPENHIHDIIDGYCKSNSRYPLIIAGNFSSSKYKKQIIQMLVEYDRPDVRLVGRLEGEEWSDKRKHCFAYIHGHEVGGTNPSLLEAMSFGNLILANDTQYNREVLGYCGIYWKTSDELAKQIQLIENEGDGGLRTRVFERAYRYDVYEIMGDYVKIFE